MNSRTSGIIGGDMVEQEEVSNLDLFVKGPSSLEWTNEKHSSYLNSMEASFVQQLYSSLESRSHKEHHSQSRSCKQTESHPTGQFKVHQNGCWKRINVGKQEPPPRQLEDRQLLLSKPWYQHYRARGRENNAVQEDVSDEGQTMRYGGRTMYSCGLMNTTEHSSGIQAYQDSNSIEYSGQNFDEDDNSGGSNQVA